VGRVKHPPPDISRASIRGIVIKIEPLTYPFAIGGLKYSSSQTRLLYVEMTTIYSL
jgi:hypothetical protein